MDQSKRKYYPLLDLIKTIAAAVIIFFHCFPKGSSVPSFNEDVQIGMNIGQAFLHALLRFGVPCFFVISSFLLFKKINEKPENKGKYIAKFCTRVGYLTLFWFFLASVQQARDFYNFISTGNYYELIHRLVIIFLKGPGGYWYLVALVVSVLITSLIKSKKSFITIFVISILMYLVAISSSTYLGLFPKEYIDLAHYLEFHNSLFAGLFYVVMGYIIANRKTYKIKGHLVWLILSFFLMTGELFITLNFKWFFLPDAYISLPLYIYLLITYALSFDIKNEKFIKIAGKGRKVGGLLYLYQFQFFSHYYYMCECAGTLQLYRDNYMYVIIPVIICYISAYLLQTAFESLSKNYYQLNFLKYSY